ncbi:DHA2 family efflux MFS transporter permease subunit [Paenibacillus flagellatus]|uniref:MFS transporter n=1 Tax=Paenibacillus flagellatus TaxID=2211139 RepID=A0A2V5K9I9_9BACL|nr:DHA2 family efflux MFS transporter permease subunit [Paenibacillus flagellatus]PYI50480.1 MFS transporter [Paenibacillus flagellatus]
MQNRSKTGLIVLAMALGLLMASLDNTITSAAISPILKDIGGFDRMAWVFTAYMLASTSTMLVFGKLSDMFGRKRFYLIGITIFLIGSALCGLADSMEQLIAFRAIQGIGSGALFPISFTIIFTIFSDPKQAAKLSGVFAGIFGLSSVAGPQLGTWISDHLGWRWCFYVNVPLGLLSFLVLLFALKESRSERKPKIDYFGTILLVVCTVSFMLALEWGGKDYAWTSLPIVGLFATAVVAGVLFVLAERKAEEPVLPLHLFRNRMVLGTSLTVFCQGAIMFSAIAYLPILSVAVLGRADSNGLLTPMMFSLMVGAIVFGMLQAKFAFRTLMAFAMTAGIVISYLLSRVGPDASVAYMTVLMAVLGFGAIGPLMSVSQNAMAMSVDKRYIGVSSSIVGFWRNIGGVLGASLMATSVNNGLRSMIEAGAESRHIPADQIDTLANPELLMRAGANVPQDILQFVRDSLGAAINHGFWIAIGFAVLGLLAAVYAGPGRYVRPQEKPAAEIAV